MDRESKMISRTELYNQVWEVPMMNLAKQYGLSDVGLAKICKKCGIPRPPRGYWARKAGGYNMKRLPLPKGDDVAIEINPSIWSQSVYKREDSLAGMSPPQEVDEEPILVPDRLSSPHPLTRQSSEILTGLQTNELGLVNPPKTGCLGKCVGEQDQWGSFRTGPVWTGSSMQCSLTKTNNRELLPLSS